MMYVRITPESTPKERAEAMVYIDHPCDPGCCPEAECHVRISIYRGDEPDPSDEVSSCVSGPDLDKVESETRAVVQAIIEDAERRTMLRAAKIASSISQDASAAILAIGNTMKATPEELRARLPKLEARLAKIYEDIKWYDLRGDRAGAHYSYEARREVQAEIDAIKAIV